MKYNKVDLKEMTEAINEYNTTTQTYDEICDKFGIEKYTFYYHLRRKHRRNTKTQTGGEVVNHDINISCTNRKTQAINDTTETDSDGNKLVFLKTDSKK